MDARADDPSWGASAPSGEKDFVSGRGLIYPGGEAGMIFLDRPASPPTSETCSKQLGYDRSNVEIELLDPGSYFCIKTSGERYASAKVTEVDGSGDVTFDVVTYKRPGDPK